MIDGQFLVLAFAIGLLAGFALMAIVVNAIAANQPPPLRVSIQTGFYASTPEIGSDYCHRGHWYKVAKLGQFQGGGRYIEIVREEDTKPRPAQRENSVPRPAQTGVIRKRTF